MFCKNRDIVKLVADHWVHNDERAHQVAEMVDMGRQEGEKRWNDTGYRLQLSAHPIAARESLGWLRKLGGLLPAPEPL
jgi:hypothetical protein